MNITPEVKRVVSSLEAGETKFYTADNGTSLMQPKISGKNINISF